MPALIFGGCAFEEGSDPAGEAAQSLEGYECVLDAPSVAVTGATCSTLDVEVCAGPSGAPGGFTLQWVTKDAFAEAGYEWTGEECSASFGPLAADQCVTVVLGDLGEESGVCDSCKELECGTEYVVRGRAEASCDCRESEYSCPTKGWTDECKEEDKGCTLTQGFWKNHPEAWPVSSLTLGSVEYTQEQLLAILNAPVKGNGLIQLAHQLIAAKLNVASGASDDDVADDIAAADALIGGLVVPPIGSGFLATSATSSLNDDLSDFNEGETGPGHCEPEEETE